MLVGGAAVEDLDDHLDVGGVEEPEVAGVRGEVDAAAVAGRAVPGFPVGRHAEAAVVEAQGGGVGDARRRVRMSKPNDLAPEAVDVVGRPEGAVGTGDQSDGCWTEIVVGTGVASPSGLIRVIGHRTAAA